MATILVRKDYTLVMVFPLSPIVRSRHSSE